PQNRATRHYNTPKRPREENQETGAEHGAEQRGQPAQDDDGDELDREEKAELLRIQEADDERAEGAGQARVQRADGERDGLVAGEVHAHGGRRALVVADGQERPTQAPSD